MKPKYRVSRSKLYFKNPETVLWVSCIAFVIFYLIGFWALLQWAPSYFICIAIFYFPILLIDRLAGYIKDGVWYFSEDHMLLAGLQALAWITIVPIYLVILAFYKLENFSSWLISLMKAWFND